MDSIASWKTNRWLVFSSFLFLFPSVYSYYKQSYFLSITLATTSIVSANHWRNARLYSFCRSVDLFVSKLSFLILFLYNLIYIKLLLHRILIYSNLGILLICFYLSTNLYTNTVIWCIYHFTFHIICISNTMLIIYNI